MTPKEAQNVNELEREIKSLHWDKRVSNQLGAAVIQVRGPEAGWRTRTIDKLILALEASRETSDRIETLIKQLGLP